MNRSFPIVKVVLLLLLFLAVGGGIYIASKLRSSSPPLLQQATSSLPTVMSSELPTSVPTIQLKLSPTVPGENLFTDPHGSIYEPGKGFKPDALRIIDITTLQIGLEKYQVAKGKYPASLQGILPDFAPMYGGKVLESIPVDPETHQPYYYKVSADGMSYQLSATLASGEQYVVVEPHTP